MLFTCTVTSPPPHFSSPSLVRAQLEREWKINCPGLGWGVSVGGGGWYLLLGVQVWGMDGEQYTALPLGTEGEGAAG